MFADRYFKRLSPYDDYHTIYAGKFPQQTEQNLMNELGEYQSITQSAMSKIIHTATKNGSCTFRLNYHGKLESIR